MWRLNTIEFLQFFFSCVKSTKLKLLLQAHLPFVEEPAYRFRRAMLVRDTAATYCQTVQQYVAAVSRTSIARRNRYAGSSTNGRWACRSSFSFVLFTQLKKNCKNSIVFSLHMASSSFPWWRTLRGWNLLLSMPIYRQTKRTLQLRLHR